MNGELYVGDFLNHYGVTIEPGSVDLVFADPPYNIGYDYDGEYDDNVEPENYRLSVSRWVWAMTSVLKDTGSLWFLIGDEYAADVRQALNHQENEGRLIFRNWIIWHYTFGQNCRTKFNRSHAHLFYCVRSSKATFNRDAIAVPSARQAVYGDKRAKSGGKLPDDVWYLRPQDVEKEGVERYFQPDEDVWYVPRVCGTFKERQGWHPCQLPEALLERIIRVSSNPGDTVFDPFAGSGTTLAVAERLGRRWIGCELSPRYAQLATDRIRKVEDNEKQS